MESNCKFRRSEDATIMKTLQTLIILFFGLTFLSCNQLQTRKENKVNNSTIAQTTLINIKAGHEADGFILNKSSIQNAVDKYGTNETLTIAGVVYGLNTDNEGTGTFVTYQIYLKNNIIVRSTKEYFGIVLKKIPVQPLNELIIDHISIYYPDKAVTEKGIQLNSDDISKVLHAYGKPENDFFMGNNRSIHYYSLGISFLWDTTNKHIENIDIYRKGQRPQFYHWFNKFWFRK
jgi:hypothetical protein